MSTTYGATRLGQAAAKRQVYYSPLEKYWDAFLERRKRQRLRATLCDLSDRELMDIGTTRGEIDYVASNRGIDPRGIRSAEWARYLPTVDGQIVNFQTHPCPETDFRQGSKPVLTVPKVDFRSTPINGHHQTGPVGPFRASFGPEG
jgi:uncharacterized protein YjiS (DUF1127 family)